MINQKDNASIPPPSEPETKECIACHKNIHLDAGICHYCRSPQYRSKKKLAIAWLKWIGGVTAIISLTVSSINLNDIVISAKRRSTAVEELVTGAVKMRELENMDSAFNLLSQALTIDPISKTALALQVEIAMKKVRDASGHIDKKNIKSIEPLIPIIERGIGISDKRKAADALAHLGWIHFLRSNANKKKYKADMYFQEAFKLDADNYYAHVLRANWYLTGQRYKEITNPVEKAMHHYRQAEKSSRKMNDLEKIIWRNLAGTRFDGADIIMLNRANDYRMKGEKIDREIREFIMTLCCKTFVNEKKIKTITHEIPPQTLKKIFTWIQTDNAGANNETLKCKNTFEGRYLSIMLDDISGDTLTTMSRYRALLGDIRREEGKSSKHYMVKRNIAQKIFNRLDIRPAEIGISGKSLYGEDFEKLTGNWCCGYQIEKIKPSGPANVAGMKYDDIIISVDGQIAHSRVNDQIAVLGSPGEEITITLLRAGAPLTLPCRPAAMDDASLEKFIQPITDTNPYTQQLLDRHLYPSGLKTEHRIGARITDLTDIACHDFSISPGTRGVLILYTHQEARTRGLKTGDAILTVSGTSITQSGDLTNAISQAVEKKENAIKIDVLRDGKVTPVIFPLFKENK